METKKNIQYQRKCLACGKVHKDICPIVKNKLEKYMNSTRKNFFWGNVLLECIRKKVDFCQILYEIAEQYEEIELLTGKMFDVTVMPIELVLEYVAVSLNTSSKKFFRNPDETAEEYVAFLKKGDLVGERLDADNNKVYQINFEFENDDYREAKLIRDFGFWSHEYEFVLGKNNDNEIYELRVRLPITIMSKCDGSELKKKYPKGRYFWWESLFDASGNEILLVSEETGKLQKYFESMLDTYWTLDSLIEDGSYTDKKYRNWMKKLEEQTKSEILDWRKYNRGYLSKCEDTDIQIEMNSKDADEMFLSIRCLNGLGIRFGKNEESLTNGGQYEEEKQRLKNLVELIEQKKKEKENYLLDNKLHIKEVKHTDVVEVVHSMACHRANHKVVPCKGIVPILTKDNKQSKFETYIGYCMECDKYYMFHSDYKELLKTGTPLCAVYDLNKVETIYEKMAFKYKSQSVLNAMGYTVSMNAKLDKEERQDILRKALDSHLFEVSDLVNFLNWLIQTREPQPKYGLAVQKWMEDLFFVKEYKNTERNVVNIKAINVR